MPSNDVNVWLKEFTFGKYKGKSYSEVLNSDPDYFDWVIKNCPKKIPNKYKLKKELTDIITPHAIIID